MPTSITGSGLINGLALPTDSIKPALVHLHKETFSAVSSVSINDVFSIEYDNYRFLIRGKCVSSTPEALIRFSVGGVPNTSGTYDRQQLYGEVTSVGAVRSTTGTSMRIGFFNATGAVLSGDIFAPALSERTFVSCHASRIDSSVVDLFGGGFNNTTTFDGITLFPSFSTITGSISIYGYRNT
jgi:hypothetical protein